MPHFANTSVQFASFLPHVSCDGNRFAGWLSWIFPYTLFIYTRVGGWVQNSGVRKPSFDDDALLSSLVWEIRLKGCVCQ